MPISVKAAVIFVRTVIQVIFVKTAISVQTATAELVPTVIRPVLTVTIDISARNVCGVIMTAIYAMNAMNYVTTVTPVLSVNPVMPARSATVKPSVPNAMKAANSAVKSVVQNAIFVIIVQYYATDVTAVPSIKQQQKRLYNPPTKQQVL